MYDAKCHNMAKDNELLKKVHNINSLIGRKATTASKYSYKSVTQVAYYK